MPELLNQGLTDFTEDSAFLLLSNVSYTLPFNGGKGKAIQAQWESAFTKALCCLMWRDLRMCGSQSFIGFGDIGQRGVWGDQSLPLGPKLPLMKHLQPAAWQIFPGKCCAPNDSLHLGCSLIDNVIIRKVLWLRTQHFQPFITMLIFTLNINQAIIYVFYVLCIYSRIFNCRQKVTYSLFILNKASMAIWKGWHLSFLPTLAKLYPSHCKSMK